MRIAKNMPLRHTLLGLLHGQPMHGYLLRQHTQEYSWIYPMTNASIYPALHGLEGDGFITHREEVHNGRARKVYDITDAGRAELRRWVIDPTPHGMTFRDQMLLKIAMQTDDTIRYARLWIEEALRDLVADREQYRARLEGEQKLAHYARLALEYGLEMLQVRIGLLEQVLEAASRPGDRNQNAMA